MASLEQIGEALKRADAAGDVAGATKLAQAYKALADHGGTPSPTPPSPVIRAGQDIAYAGQYDDQPQRPDLVSSIGATANGLVNGIPILGPLAQGATDIMGGGIAQLTGGNFNDYIQHQRDVRNQYAEQAPVASLAGNIGGALGSLGGAGTIPAVAEALGITGAKTLPRIVNSVASTQILGAGDNMARGQKPTDAFVGALTPAFAGGIGGPLIGKVVEGTGNAIARALTKGAQGKITDAALAANPGATSKSLKTTASSQFDQAFGKDQPALSDTAMMKLVSSISNEVKDYRPNEHTSKEAVGVLQHVMELADAANTPGTVVDLKDLHILRQTANSVRQQAGASDTSKTIAGKVVNTLDDFIGKLGPDDILGGADPTQAAISMKQAIKTWAVASKVGLIEDAVRHADTYKSGVENGLKLSFLRLMDSPDFRLFSKVEQDAIREVAKGTTKQNIAELFGKLGVSFGGGAAHNIVGAGFGTSGATALLTPILGPAALPAALGITTAAGIAGRRVAEGLARSGADRAASIAATPGIAQALQRPNMLAPAAKPLEILVRGGAQGLSP